MKQKRFVGLALILSILMLFFLACSNTARYDKAVESPPMAKEEVYEISDRGEPAAGEFVANEDPAEFPQKIIYTFDIGIETLDATGTNETMESLVKKYDGYIEEASAWGLNDSDKDILPRFQFTLKIPTEKVEAFIQELNVLGDVKNMQRYRENMSTVYYDTKARLENKKLEEERVRELLKAAESMEDILALEARLSELREQIEYFEGDLRQIDRDVSRSTVFVNISQVEEFTKTFNRQASFKDRVTRYLEISYETLRDGMEFLLYFVIVFGPWLILLALILVLIVIHRRKKKEKKRLQYLEDQKQIAAMYNNKMPPVQANEAPKPVAEFITVEDKTESVEEKE